MGDRPPLGNIEAKQRCQLFRCLAGDGVSPGAEGRQLLSVLVKGQIAVHHGGNADGAHAGELCPELFPYVPFQFPEAVLNALFDLLKGVGPYALFQPVFPDMAARGHRPVAVVDQYGLDPRGAEFNTQDRFFPVQHGAPHFSFQIRSFTSSSSSSFSGLLSAVIWTNSMSIILAQSRICSALTS